MRNKFKNKKMLGPVITMIILIAIVIFLSAFCSLIELDAERTEIVRGTLETSLITVNNVLTKDGIRFVIGNVVTSLQTFEPLYLLTVVQ